jgi:hypothetical protein
MGDALDYAAVFEDAAEELHILGKLVPPHYQYTESADEVSYFNYKFFLTRFVFFLKIVRNQVERVLSTQHKIEDEYDAQISHRSQLQRNKTHDTLEQPNAKESQKLMDELSAELKKTTADLKTGVNKINRMFSQNPLTADNMKKVEQDR